MTAFCVRPVATIGGGGSTSDAQALSYYNAIRTRAGLSTKTTITYEEVFNERRVEFGMEGINWFDVKRRFYRENNTIGTWFLVNGQLRNVRAQLIDNGRRQGDARVRPGGQVGQRGGAPCPEPAQLTGEPGDPLEALRRPVRSSSTA